MRLRKSNLLAVALAAAMALPAGWASAEQIEDAAAASGDARRLLKAVGVPGIMSHERVLQWIADRSGDTRASGTIGYTRSADYVAAQLKGAGYAVRFQPFTFILFEETAVPTLARVAPTARTYGAGTDFLTMEYSGSGDVVRGPVVGIGLQVPPSGPDGSSTSGCAAGDFPAPPAADAVALIQRGTCTFGSKATLAAAAGYAAAIIFNEGQPGRTDLLNGTLGDPVSIPVLGATYALGAELAGLLRSGPVTVNLSTQTRSTPQTSRNVIADSPGGRADRVVVVGAHLDSVPEGPGINDNGSGTATILEIARQMARLHLRPVNKLRFAFWGAEESGLVGSQHYVDSLSEAQAARIMLNLNFDMVGSPNFVRFVYDGDGSATPDDPDAAGPPGSAAIERVFLRYFRGVGLATEPTAFDGRSDYGPFIAVGIPAGGLFTGAEGLKTAREARIYGGQAGVAYDRCYHQACDTLRNLSKVALDQMGDAAAFVTLTLANRATPLAPTAAAATAQAKAAGKRAALLYRGSKLQR